MESTECLYHGPKWWAKHPRANRPEVDNAVPLFDIVFWQTKDGKGLYRTFTYCPMLSGGDLLKEEQLNKLAVKVTDALLRGMAEIGVMHKLPSTMIEEIKGERGIKRILH